MSELLNKYFAKLLFTKVDEKEGYAIYGAGIYSGLAGIQRYVLVFVKSQYATKLQAHIHELFYENIQTRQMAGSYKLQKQTFVCPTGGIDPLFHVESRTKTHSIYKSDEVPFTLTLLNDPKKNTLYQYNNKIMLSAAIFMFNTTMTIENAARRSGDVVYNKNIGINDSFELL